jgi:hypothetical protein
LVLNFFGKFKFLLHVFWEDLDGLRPQPVIIRFYGKKGLVVGKKGFLLGVEGWKCFFDWLGIFDGIVLLEFFFCGFLAR